MSIIKVAVDAMGGDNAPSAIVKGAVEAVNKIDNVKVILVGKEEPVKAELSHYQYDEGRLTVVNATQVLDNSWNENGSFWRRGRFCVGGKYRSAACRRYCVYRQDKRYRENSPCDTYTY